MRIPLFHNYGNPIQEARVQVFINKLTNLPSDSKIPSGYSIQLNTANPKVMFDEKSWSWVPLVAGKEKALAFQQAVLQIWNYPPRNDVSYFNLNADVLTENLIVEYRLIQLPNEVHDRLKRFGGEGRNMQCIELAIHPAGMDLKIYDGDTANGVKLIYELLNQLPYRTDKSEALWRQRETPIAPFYAFEVRVVGAANGSRATFPKDTQYTATILPAKNMVAEPAAYGVNIRDSTFPYELNLEALRVSTDVTIPPTLLTAESSDLTATIDTCRFIGSYNWKN
jgi:hypothetical protein